MKELVSAKPCPFCGEKYIILSEGSTFRWRIALCDTCGASCGEVRIQTCGPGTHKEREAHAIEDVLDEWNKRA